MTGLYEQPRHEPQMTRAKSRPFTASVDEIKYVKICRDCFRDIYGAHELIQTLTWGRECARCYRPSPSLSTLAKIEASIVERNPYMTPCGPIMSREQKLAMEREKRRS